MIEFFEWFTNQRSTTYPQQWLILGKGPSFSTRANYDLKEFSLLGLNHVMREQDVDLAHMIDIDVIEDCQDVISERAKFVLLPWVPHQNNEPGEKTLEDYCKEIPVLSELSTQGRLLWYNAATASGRAHKNSPVVPVKFFSAEAAVNLLAMGGTKTIRTLGIDGGTDYSNSFSDLSDRTRLNNQQASFDIQFQTMARSQLQHDLDIGPLDMQLPVPIFVGGSADQDLATAVLSYSIRKHSSVSVRVIPLHSIREELPCPSAPENQPRTPFSFQRFLIPEAMNHEGWAIYMDSDMQVFRDIRQLWQLQKDGVDLMAVGDAGDRKPQFSVMMLNCASLGWRIEDIVEGLDQQQWSYETLMQEMPVAKTLSPAIPACWNSLESWSADETALLHYTDMHTQPWLARGHRYEALWFADLFEAMDHGFITEQQIADYAAAGYLRPSIIPQVEKRAVACDGLTRAEIALDKDYRAPFGFVPKHKYRSGVTRRWHHAAGKLSKEWGRLKRRMA